MCRTARRIFAAVRARERGRDRDRHLFGRDELYQRLPRRYGHRVHGYRNAPPGRLDRRPQTARARRERVPRLCHQHGQVRHQRLRGAGHRLHRKAALLGRLLRKDQKDPAQQRPQPHGEHPPEHAGRADRPQQQGYPLRGERKALHHLPHRARRDARAHVHVGGGRGVPRQKLCAVQHLLPRQPRPRHERAAGYRARRPGRAPAQPHEKAEFPRRSHAVRGGGGN